MKLNNMEFHEKYWHYYLVLEKELLDISEYIPIREENFNTISLKYMKLLLSICSEIEIVFKEFMKYNEKECKKGTIKKYHSFMMKNFPDFVEYSLCSERDIEFYPFKEWKEPKDEKEKHVLSWWQSHNNLKHSRTSENNFIEANQLNVLNALGALYQLENYFYKQIIENDFPKRNFLMPLPQSDIFRINWDFNSEVIGNVFYFGFDKDGDEEIIGIGNNFGKSIKAWKKQ